MTDERAQRFKRLSSAVVYDILDQMGFPNQAVSIAVRPIDGEMTVAGPAFTIQAGSLDHSISGVSSFEVFRHLQDGDVMVMSTGGHAVSAPWGENSSISAMQCGATGLVMDTGTRDAAAIVDRGFPTFCTYVSPVFAKGRFQMNAHSVAIKLPGQVHAEVDVRPGDYVVGDRDGVVIVPAAIIDEVLDASEQLEEIENRIRDGLLAGEDRETVYKNNPKFAHLKKN